jgi:hypothetical protein
MSREENLCITTCPKYLLCEKMRKQGLASQILAGSQSSMVEYMAEDGSIISSAEFWGTEDLSPERLQLFEEAGSTMVEAAQRLQATLLAGCDGRGPEVLTADISVCRSSNAGEVDFTEQDLQ